MLLLQPETFFIFLVFFLLFQTYKKVILSLSLVLLYSLKFDFIYSLHIDIFCLSWVI